MDYNSKYSSYLERFNIAYKKAIDSLDKNSPGLILEAIKYATCDGGKRVRPVLAFASAEMLGVDCESVAELAVAIELIHSYSLVHDDLPCMDNDDIRRGKLSTHKKFGEAVGVLAGDALLNLAFEIVLNKSNFTSYDAEALKLISNFAGYSGMIAGQVMDMLNEKNSQVGIEDLYYIYLNKTSKLITVPLLVASAFKDKLYFEKLKTFGFNLGYMFQITDDLLDAEGSIELIGKTPGKDEEAGKLTAIKLLGIDGAKAKALEHYNVCKEVLSEIPNSEFLLKFVEKIYTRKK